MTNNIDAPPNERSLQQLTKIAITSEIGAIDHLPQEVIERIWNIYQDDNGNNERHSSTYPEGPLLQRG